MRLAGAVLLSLLPVAHAQWSVSFGLCYFVQDGPRQDGVRRDDHWRGCSRQSGTLDLSYYRLMEFGSRPPPQLTSIPADIFADLGPMT